ncbi:putative zinc-binding alcohol dehydrogenase [Mycobacterium talmoniae]|uniref:Putative zinc-binding alcohol dehydrogenase n=1 Tax=Mycobacterium talmoniae TaxID=1858794 RepID=A0A2S8BP46_9MYCO|nr:putative zinc-binding alcohol dehydrogenase [Mycobacterium talmoniae]
MFGVDGVAGRRDRAAAAGATPVEVPGTEALLAATGGRGVDAVIDAVGSDASMTAALSAVRPGGTVSVVGVHDLAPFPFPALAGLLRSVTLRLTTAPVQRTWPQLIPLLVSGRLDVDGLFTNTLPLSEAAAGYAAVAARSGDELKVILTP